jgi:hypothetical protein
MSGRELLRKNRLENLGRISPMAYK